MVRGLSGAPGSLDPQRAEDAFSFDVLRDLYEGLTASAPDGEAIPAGATSWSVSPDGLNYLFELRDDARWSDGSPVLARHYVLGFRRAVDPATASGGADLLKAIVNAAEALRGDIAPSQLGVTANGDYKLEIRLVRPVPYFADILTNTVASPAPDQSMDPGYRYSDPGTVITNGPYSLAEVVSGSSIRLLRNGKYHSPASVPFSEVRYQIVADEMSEFSRFRAGEIDVTNSVPEQHFESLQENDQSGLQYRAALATFYYSFNSEQGPLKGRPRLREALSLAVNRSAITEKVAAAGQVPAWSLVPEGVWNYSSRKSPAAIEGHEKNIALARSLLAQEGYSRAKPLRLRVLYNDNQLVERVTLAIAATWKEELGVESELRKLEFRGYLAAREDPAQWDVVRVGWSADYNDASSFLDTLMRGSPQNFGRWHSDDYESLLVAASLEGDAARRRELLEQAEHLMLSEHPVMPVYFYVLRRLVSPRIAAPPINPLNRSYSRDFSPAQ